MAVKIVQTKGSYAVGVARTLTKPTVQSGGPNYVIDGGSAFSNSTMNIDGGFAS
jgi:hypothetical protein